MNFMLEIILALLSAAGLLSLGWVLFGRMLLPMGGRSSICAVVSAFGDGDNLEHDITALLWMRGGGAGRFTIIIADGGLTPTGRGVAAALLARTSGMVVCPMGELSRYLGA